MKNEVVCTRILCKKAHRHRIKMDTKSRHTLTQAEKKLDTHTEREKTINKQAQIINKTNSKIEIRVTEKVQNRFPDRPK